MSLIFLLLIILDVSCMITTLTIISLLLIIISVLPFIQHQHWIFRVSEFIKIQLLCIQIIIFSITMLYVQDILWLWVIQGFQFISIVYHVYILMRFTKFWKTKIPNRSTLSSDKIKIISCNVYQFNKEHQHFIDLVQKEQPDIFVTMESNAEWEKAMRIFEKDYPTQQKVTLENTYGMHFYSKLNVIRVETHYFVSDDIPSIEAEVETRDGYRFIFFAVHPPPPSPTEEDTSKERDGDLLSVAKKVKTSKLPVIVTGDFNNVAWARSSILFKKTSALIDARIGRGILSTFHAKYWFFRIPLDLLFHSTTILVDKLFTYPSVGSDHFPIGCTFHIDLHATEQEKDVERLQADEVEEVEVLIEEGKAEESENR